MKKIAVSTALLVVPAISQGADAPTPTAATPITMTPGRFLALMLPGTTWIADQPGGFFKEIAFTKDGQLVRTDSRDHVLRSTYLVSGDGTAVTYKKADGTFEKLIFAPSQRSFQLDTTTYKRAGGQ